MQPATLAIDANSQYDDDGRIKRTGTLMTTSAHIITAVIGSGVLSLAWAIAQLGWVAGPIALVAFSVITWFTSSLLADCYRSPDPITGKRNYTYMDAVKANLGGMKVKLCGLAQYVNLVGVCIGYTITSSISMGAIKKSNCYHKYGHDHEGCKTSNNMFMIIFGCSQIFLSQIPNFHKLSILSIIAAVMSFGYASIGFGLSLAKVVADSLAGNHVRTSLTGTTVGLDVTSTQKVWNTFQALGNIAFAYAYSTILIEIQDTIKSNDSTKAAQPENKVMKKATFVAVSVTTLFYSLCGLLGYAAFGNKAPGNFLTGFGFYEPFWLVDIANLAIVIHLVGAYQVFGQPVYSFVEQSCTKRWPESRFITRTYPTKIPFLGNLSLFRLVWRTAFVVMTTIVAMILPFFNDFLGLLGAISFWPLTVYFPIEMYISHAKIRKCSRTWVWLQLISWVCLIVSLLAAAGSIQGLTKALKSFKLFMAVS